MTHCLIGIGSNLGNRRAILEDAINRLSQCAGIDVMQCSKWIPSLPVGGPAGQSPFLNGAVTLDTDWSALDLMEKLLEIETAAGRTRGQRWGPRRLDLDLLLFGDSVVDAPQLKVPHPWMAVRHFVLSPAVQVAPEMIHPQIGWTMSQLLSNLSANPLNVSLVGLKTDAQWQRLRELAECLEADLLCPSDKISLQLSAGSRVRLVATDWVDTPDWMASVPHEGPPTNLLILLEYDPVQLSPVESEHQRGWLATWCQAKNGPWLRLNGSDLISWTKHVTAAIRGMVTYN